MTEAEAIKAVIDQRLALNEGAGRHVDNAQYADLPESEAYWIDHLYPDEVRYVSADNRVRVWSIAGGDQPTNISIAGMESMATSTQYTLRRVERREALRVARDPSIVKRKPEEAVA